MDIVETLILVFHVLAALAIIGLVLVQQGKGADMGSGFGGGSSNTVFGSVGSGNFLTRATTTIAIAFFVTSFVLAFFAKQHSEEARNIGIPTVIEQPVPAVEVPVDQGSTDSEVPRVDSAGENNAPGE
ncbi:MAG: preprotein translocase subunit SecG [Pseudomonadota bacterium]